jgi:hypothetical protein
MGEAEGPEQVGFPPANDGACWAWHCSSDGVVRKDVRAKNSRPRQVQEPQTQDPRTVSVRNDDDSTVATTGSRPEEAKPMKHLSEKSGLPDVSPLRDGNGWLGSGSPLSQESGSVGPETGSGHSICRRGSNVKSHLWLAHG